MNNLDFDVFWKLEKSIEKSINELRAEANSNKPSMHKANFISYKIMQLVETQILLGAVSEKCFKPNDGWKNVLQT